MVCDFMLPLKSMRATLSHANIELLDLYPIFGFNFVYLLNF